MITHSDSYYSYDIVLRETKELNRAPFSFRIYQPIILCVILPPQWLDA